MIETNIFSFIRNNVDIVNVISEYILLKPFGNYWKGLSPFKSEKTPSFTVTPDKKIYYCFSTSSGGDIINFISRIENCNQFEAAMILSKKYNLKLPKNSEISNFKEPKEIYIKNCEFFLEWCKKELLNNDIALNYLKKREINENSLKNFSIGYCPFSKEGIKKFISLAQKENILIQDLINSGIIHEQRNFKNNNFNENKYYFPYEDRIIFPIMNNFGLCCGFAGRIYKDNDIRVKYINSSANKEFSKKNILYAFALAKKTIQKEKKIYFVEGYFDVISMHQAGYLNTVATMGTACNEEHMSVVSKLTNVIVALYDGDSAGQNAILKLMKLSWAESLELKIIKLPDGDDPDSIVKKNKIIDYLNKEEDSIDFYLSLKIENYKNITLKEKISVVDDLINCLVYLNDSIKINLLISEIGKKIDLSISCLEKILKEKKSIKNKEKLNFKNELIVNNTDEDKDEKNDLWLLFLISCIIFYKEKNVDIIFYSKLLENEAPEIYKDLWKNYLNFINEKNIYDHLLFFDILKNDIKDKILKKLSLYQFNLNHVGLFYKELKKKNLKFILNDLNNKNINEDNLNNNYLKEQIDEISFFYKKTKEL